MKKVEIIYEDNHLFVVNKPAGLLTQPSGTEQDSLEQRAKEWIKEKYQKPGNVFLTVVHRLDKPVSGIVIFARTTKALSRLNAAIREKKTKKFYHALVEGRPSLSEGILEHYMIHDNFRAEMVFKEHPQAKLVRLFYRIIELRGVYSLIEIELDTGRYHQIRLQMSTIGCPILGDEKYGSRTPFKEGTIALHHFESQISHPITGEMLTFRSSTPFL